MKELKQWFAVYTRSCFEQKVASLLEKKEIENYCPLNKVERQWSDRKKTVLEPLFKSYVFVRISSAQRVEVLQTTGIVNFVHWLGRPAIIKDEEIAAVKSFLKKNEYVTLERHEFNLNEKVKIIEGPLKTKEGSVVEILHKSVRVVIPSLGYQIVAKMANVEKVLVS